MINMIKILANDGLSNSGIEKLSQHNYKVITDKVSQDELAQYINSNKIEVLLVRSATKVRKDLIDSCPDLKIVGRGGVGMDNIDVDYALGKGIKVINTPAASSPSVAELVFAHLYSGVRFLHDSNRQMPTKGNKEFAQLKNNYGKGIELRGKTIGIIGIGKIGIEVARIAIGVGMNIIAVDQYINETSFDFSLNGQSIKLNITTQPLEHALKNADVISLHIPAQDGYVVGKEQFDAMKNGAAIINCARGGIVDEKAMINALNSGKLSFVGLDVFENEPYPSEELLSHPKVSLTPHIGAATMEAQDRIGTELAEQIIDFYAI